jgi:hypothetical protein
VARTAACLLASLVLASSGGVGAGVGRIHGHVYSWSCGQPLERASCNLAIPDIHLRLEGMESHRFYEVTTDRAGAYSIDVPADTYAVVYTWPFVDAANRPIVKSRAPDYGPRTIRVATEDRLVADFALRAGILL